MICPDVRGLAAPLPRIREPRFPTALPGLGSVPGGSPLAILNDYLEQHSADWEECCCCSLLSMNQSPWVPRYPTGTLP